MALLLQKMKEERNMSKSKILAIMALIAFAMGVLLVGDVVAGERVKGRAVDYVVKSEVINVPDQEGHVVGFSESKGIQTVLEGTKLFDGVVERVVGVFDMNTKTGLGSGHGYNEYTDRDGDKYFATWEWKTGKSDSSATWRIVRGTGKFEGIKGKGTWISTNVTPNQAYTDYEGEVEWPTR